MSTPIRIDAASPKRRAKRKGPATAGPCHDDDDDDALSLRAELGFDLLFDLFEGLLLLLRGLGDRRRGHTHLGLESGEGVFVVDAGEGVELGFEVVAVRGLREL